ncbi:hypothetical protein M0812_17042 [Anaeramoeba flamelloides]|uniref:Uncharacterized protein n=1 Tax=Anaeramoeba flamelloides TaxID=1746091 RepID=A0AAV7ZBY8_9EUKA|nr:hypothetical protein M0812_17042 [Anaeramoeba flamelloides]
MSRFKLVCVGDGATGKTCLLITFAKNKFPEQYVPTVFENYIADITVDGNQYELNLWDTAGQEDYDRLRPLSYPDSDVVIIGFSVDNHLSYDNVTDKWADEVDHFCPRVPKLLVGLKIDLRKDQGTIEKLQKKKLAPIIFEKGQELAKKIGAVAYVECSAKTRDGLREVFEEAVRAAKLKKKKGGCSIL